ncbi:hypothetical protein ARMSODRAFT_85094 [Armillaria solidipes]|uniref:Uncharacterized protein n=1 Tax=Armillaria solidipes TaxID=1076256 RepID=A0A2H3AM56_9AGAR|nr:hypothetical protein ARMSODRAFT_85094 [Armillaria solidipes]
MLPILPTIFSISSAKYWILQLLWSISLTLTMYPLTTSSSEHDPINWELLTLLSVVDSVAILCNNACDCKGSETINTPHEGRELLCLVFKGRRSGAKDMSMLNMLSSVYTPT